MPPSLKPSRDWPFALAIGVGLFILNSFLVSPFIGWYDTGEMVGATVCFGISHPSGQVLFHLLGKLSLLLPFSTPAYRLGLMSAAFSAIASSLFWILANRLAYLASPNLAWGTRSTRTLKWWLLFLTLAWSLSLPWWRYSLVPLVYALHLLLGMLVLWVLSSQRPFKWQLAFFILGISTVFRPTQFFALPFVGMAFLHEFYRQPLFPPWPVALAGDYHSSRKQFAVRVKKKGLIKSLLLLMLSFALGRSTAFYLPLRSALHPDIAFADLTHFSAFFHHVFALKFSKSVGAVSVATFKSVLHQMLAHFWSDLTVIGIVLILWGALLVWWRKEKVPAFLWVAIGWGLTEVLFVFTIPFPTFESHQMLLGWVYSGLLAAIPLAFLEQLFRRGQYRFLKSATTLFLVGFPLLQLTLVGHLLDRKKERGAEDYGRNVLEILEPKALYIPNEENEYFPVVGYQQSFGARKDIQVLEPGTPDWVTAKAIKDCLENGKPLYVTRKWAVPPGWGYQEWGPLLKVVRGEANRFVPVPGMIRTEHMAAWGNLHLEMVQVKGDLRPGGWLEISYPWYRFGKSSQDQSNLVVILFVDKDGHYLMKDGILWLHDIHEGPFQAAAQAKSLSCWWDRRLVFIPSDFPPGSYRLMVGLQKKIAVGEKGWESFRREFYERNGEQNLEKFSGRGSVGSVLQFLPGQDKSISNELWPVTKSLFPLVDPRFAPVAEITIQPRD